MGKKTPKKEMNNPPFLWRHMADLWDTLSSYKDCKFLAILSFYMPNYEKGKDCKNFLLTIDRPTDQVNYICILRLLSLIAADSLTFPHYISRRRSDGYFEL